MRLTSRLIFAGAACLLLSSCGLIATALRLAPYYLLFADERSPGGAPGKTVKMRGQEVQGKGIHGIPHSPSASHGSQVAVER
jgi:hypothetical protein